MFALLQYGLGIALLMGCVDGHGTMTVPPSRPYAYKEGFKTPRDYDPMAKNCGGMIRQWTDNGGKCGICGDPYDEPQPRTNENGGKQGTGTIVREYIQAQVIPVEVTLTAPHKGYFEFRICALEDTSRPATLECLNRHLLVLTDGRTRYMVGDSRAIVHSLAMRLPHDLTCEHCVIQWKYHAGNSWGVDEYGEGIGHGVQEEFYGCSDVRIKPFSLLGEGTLPPATTTTTRKVSSTTIDPARPPTTTRSNAHGPAGSSVDPGSVVTPPSVDGGFTCKFQYPTGDSFFDTRLDELCGCACNNNAGVCKSEVCFCY